VLCEMTTLKWGSQWYRPPPYCMVYSEVKLRRGEAEDVGESMTPPLAMLSGVTVGEMTNANIEESMTPARPHLHARFDEVERVGADGAQRARAGSRDEPLPRRRGCVLLVQHLQVGGGEKFRLVISAI